MSESEHPFRMMENELMYEDCYTIAKSNFSEFDRAMLVKGEVPDSLTKVDIEAVSYLSLDMNIAEPEVAALEHFWDKLVSGGIVIFDDYGWNHYREQYDAINAISKRFGVMVATLPTGQGILIKP